jgi:16S rRNA (cytidine1402-2'-O)-methyltransferase
LKSKTKSQFNQHLQTPATTGGCLIVVGLSIGNLKDISERSLQVLRTADLVLAEDTREIRKLINVLDLPHSMQTWSYREQNHDRAWPQILLKLQQGAQIALVSDRGTPTISDPGYRLVQAVWEAGFTVTTAPGPSAVIAALSISGLPTDRFTFLGFLPRTASKQRKILSQFAELNTTLIMYESPFRIRDLVTSIQESLGPERQLVLARELTKLHEEVIRGTVAEVAAQIAEQKLLGEFVVLVR